MLEEGRMQCHWGPGVSIARRAAAPPRKLLCSPSEGHNSLDGARYSLEKSRKEFIGRRSRCCGAPRSTLSGAGDGRGAVPTVGVGEMESERCSMMGSSIWSSALAAEALRLRPLPGRVASDPITADTRALERRLPSFMFASFTRAIAKLTRPRPRSWPGAAPLCEMQRPVIRTRAPRSLNTSSPGDPIDT